MATPPSHVFLNLPTVPLVWISSATLCVNKCQYGALYVVFVHQGKFLVRALCSLVIVVTVHVILRNMFPYFLTCQSCYIGVFFSFFFFSIGNLKLARCFKCMLFQLHAPLFCFCYVLFSFFINLKILSPQSQQKKFIIIN